MTTTTTRSRAARKMGAPEPIAALNRVRILETGEPLVDIRRSCPGVAVREECCPYLRATVAEMLNAAVARLPQGYGFQVGTALRTLAMQKRHWDAYYRSVCREHPEWPLSARRRATNRFFAPYDQPAPPGHCTGGAVDVVLVGADGRPVDVSSPLERWDAAYTWSDRISPEARARRMVLVEAMLGAGFSNCREEYWHYSWGDSAWAVRVGEDTCPYGLTPAPVAVEAYHDGAAAGRIERIGADAWLCAPAPLGAGARTALDVCVQWSQGRPIELRVAPVVPRLFASADRKRWSLLPARLERGALVISLVPGVERLFVASEPAPATSDSA